MADSNISSAITWIGSMLLNEANFLYGVEGQVRSLKGELEFIEQHLKEAEDQKLQGPDPDRQLSVFTDNMQLIAFRAEDIIDAYILQVGSMGALRKFACFPCYLLQVRRVGNEIDSIKSDRKEAFDNLNMYKGQPALKPAPSRDVRRPTRVLPSYAHTEEEFVVGLDFDIDDLVRRVTDAEDRAWVVGIAGIGGLGKTTRARKIYNHIRVKNHFTCTAWIFISQQWDRRKILLELLRQTRGGRGDNLSDEELVELIFEFLKEEQLYLIVLDDIWETEAWRDVCPALPKSQGNKIILTTRDENLPRYTDAGCHLHKPNPLTRDQSWELFSKIAIKSRTTTMAEAETARFEQLGRKMVHKCDGLPLAVITLAGLLTTKEGLDEWEHIDNSFGPNLLRGKGPAEYGSGRSIDEALALSYIHLPHHLKPCFLYLALFPEDFEISVGLLIRLWIAEGFVTPSDDWSTPGEELEDIAERFLEELVCRCVVQPVRRNCMRKLKACRLHDIMREFGIKKGREQRFLEILTSSKISAPASSAAIVGYRRASIDSGTSIPTQDSHLRSLVLFRKYSLQDYSIDDMDVLSIDPVCQSFNFLRVLNLWGAQTHNQTLPKQIGNLLHLRYLGLRATNIIKLPQSVAKLRNLLTLDHRDTFPTEAEVPDFLWSMEQLRHLYLTNRDNKSGASKPLKLHALKRLQTLWYINARIVLTEELGALSSSIRKLQIIGLLKQEQLEAVLQSPTVNSGSIRKLHLFWHRNQEVQLIDMDRLCRCSQLKKLLLSGKIREDPTLQFPRNIVMLELRLSGFNSQDFFTAIGNLGDLKVLRLFKSYEGTQLTCTARLFPQLEELVLESLDELEEIRWENGVIPRLKELVIKDCRRLQRLPEALKHMTTVQKLEIRNMPRAFCSQLKRPEDYGDKTSAPAAAAASAGGRDFYIIQHIPSIIIELGEEH
ncbi:hypothetical protein Dimus_000329 [Dionaea muscipula]